ncbi:coil containing protein [Vibrio phage 1.236.O._10N.261.52.C4]|nr:coil containing protein [Vibrio phage 1.236.O._10N.261.52.C4]
MITKALLNSNAEAIDLCEHLTSWDIPARLTVNASGNASRYVVFDSTNLTKAQHANIDAVHKPDYVRVCIEDVYFEEEIKND